ncbi:hypothetical protein BIW11_00904 [Tropilaelaps mercedesae]|uniref:Uncharacterized protein n=1 Tax=Tropilaelaps mercedesae TaxID=418985 RepID=A0A1V9XML9_9ACAR|nr:hypothetical protein BIW11_00904 [Tropilaelaps mercedesae]
MNLEFRKSLRRKKTSAAPPSVERDINAEINLKGWLYRLEGSSLKHWKKRWPKPCLGEPILFSDRMFDAPRHIEGSSRSDQESDTYHHRLPPATFVGGLHGTNGFLGPSHCHPCSPSFLDSSNQPPNLAALRDHTDHLTSHSTSAFSTPQLVGADQAHLCESRGSVQAHSLHNMCGFQNDQYQLHENGSHAYPSGSLNRTRVILTNSRSDDALDSNACSLLEANLEQYSQQGRLPMQEILTPQNTASTHVHSFASRADGNVFQHASQNWECINNKTASRRTASTAVCGSASYAEKIQSSKLGSRQSLTDSQYSTVLPESSLQLLESNSSDFHNPSPVQHFTDVPPHQLQQSDQYHKMLELRITPPKYSEACLRSEFAQKLALDQSPTGALPHASRVLDCSKMPCPPPQHEECQLRPLRMLNSRKLLYDQINYSLMDASLTDKIQVEDSYRYNREDLLKISKILYNNKIIGGSSAPGVDYRNPTALDISFQSSSHNSVFEQDAPADMNGRCNIVNRPLQTLAPKDSVNYAILKQEIEGSKVIAQLSDAQSSAPTCCAPSCITHDDAKCSSKSVSSSVSRDLRSSIIRTALNTDLDESITKQRPDMRSSFINCKHQFYRKTTPQQRNASEKLAFCESKRSPDVIRPKFAVSSGSTSSGGTGRPVPDLIDELREFGSLSSSRLAMNNYVYSASSEDILRTITATKQQRSLSLLEGPTPDVVPAQTPPYYYSDLSLPAQSSTSQYSRHSKTMAPMANVSHIGLYERGYSDEQEVKPKTDRYIQSLLRLYPQKVSPRSQKKKEDKIKEKTYVLFYEARNTVKKQSWSCENLLKQERLVVPEKMHSATCLLESEPFYENLRFGRKTSTVHGPEPQTSLVKVSLLAVSSTGARKASQTAQSSQESLTCSLGEVNINNIRGSCDLIQNKPVLHKVARMSGRNKSESEASQDLTSTMYLYGDYEENLDCSKSSLGSPDLIQSALNSSGDAGEYNNEIFEQIINSISCPSKIEIPERYVSESDSDADFSAVERLARYQKADTIRRRLAGQSRDQASRLTINQVIAKQAKQVSKIVATHH